MIECYIIDYSPYKLSAQSPESGDPFATTSESPCRGNGSVFHVCPSNSRPLSMRKPPPLQKQLPKASFPKTWLAFVARICSPSVHLPISRRKFCKRMIQNHLWYIFFSTSLLSFLLYVFDRSRQSTSSLYSYYYYLCTEKSA